MYPSLQKSQSMRSKRKSAVEMLAESKAFYVKSEMVRDSQQVLPLRLGGPCVHSSVPVRSKPIPSMMIPHQMNHQSPMGGWRPVSMPQCKSACMSVGQAVSHQLVGVPYIADMAVSPSRSLPPLRVSGRRSTSACSDVLQNKLRKLLNGDSRENVSSVDDRLIDDFIPISPPAEYAITERSSYRYAQTCSPDHRVVHKSLPDLHNNSGISQQHGATCSNKSTSNKSLSNRDSGESSGHYTHRSEPAPACTEPKRPDIRRDSGSSTQHSGASMYPPCCDSRTTRLGYPPVTYEYPPGMPYQDPTLSPGPGTFKRQKCFRYKQRTRAEQAGDSRPILRSKSDISDRYWRCGTLPAPRHGKSDGGTAVSHLEQFFEQLGLNSDSYESMLLEGVCQAPSPVYFSDVSTVDSSRPIDTSVYCAPPPFRPSEPPSIVERNARIIKWLCNCRKLQIGNS